MTAKPDPRLSLDDRRAAQRQCGEPGRPLDGGRPVRRTCPQAARSVSGSARRRAMVPAPTSAATGATRLMPGTNPIAPPDRTRGAPSSPVHSHALPTSSRAPTVLFSLTPILIWGVPPTLALGLAQLATHSNIALECVIVGCTGSVLVCLLSTFKSVGINLKGFRLKANYVLGGTGFALVASFMDPNVPICFAIGVTWEAGVLVIRAAVRNFARAYMKGRRLPSALAKLLLEWLASQNDDESKRGPS